MKKIFIIEDTLSNKVSYYHLLLFLVFLPFDRFYSELILVSLALHTLIHFRKVRLQPGWHRPVVAVQAVFLLTALPALYTTNTAEAFSLLTRQLAILLLPLVLLVNPLRLATYRRRLMAAFALTCCLTILYLYFDVLRTIRYQHLPLSALFTPAFLNHNFSWPVGLHATYLSLYAALSLVVLLLQFYEAVARKKKLLAIGGMIILWAGLLQLGSRSVLFALLFTALFLIPFFLEKKRRRSYAWLMVLFLLPAGAALYGSSSLRDRLITGPETDLGLETAVHTAATPRMERWKLGLELVRTAPLAGHGSGDETDLLREKYFAHQFYNAYLFRLNSHNQYLAIAIRSGMAGLLVYLAVLLYGFRRAWSKKDLLFLFFMVLMATVSFSENCLDVNKGIFFYAFFFSLFLLSGNKSRQSRESVFPAGNLRAPSAVLTY